MPVRCRSNSSIVSSKLIHLPFEICFEGPLSRFVHEASLLVAVDLTVQETMHFDDWWDQQLSAFTISSTNVRPICSFVQLAVFLHWLCSSLLFLARSRQWHSQNVECGNLSTWTCSGDGFPCCVFTSFPLANFSPSKHLQHHTFRLNSRSCPPSCRGQASDPKWSRVCPGFTLHFSAEVYTCCGI